MEVRNLTVPFNGRSHKSIIPLTDLHTTIKLTPIGDIHLGNKGCDEDALRKWVNIISSDPNHYTVLMGDMCDCIQPGDKRFDPHEIADWLWAEDNRGRIVDAQFDRLINILSPIPSDRIIGIIEGNHERTIRDRHQRDIVLDISRKLKIQYLGQEAFIALTPTSKKHKRSYILKIFITHGSGGGRKAGAKVNKITDITSWVNADIVLMGHHHDRFAIRTVQLDIDRNSNLIAKERLHVLTGTFLKSFAKGTAGYGARELYSPTSIGPVTITIHPKTLELGTII